MLKKHTYQIVFLCMGTKQRKACSLNCCDIVGPHCHLNIIVCFNILRNGLIFWEVLTKLSQVGGVCSCSASNASSVQTREHVKRFVHILLAIHGIIFTVMHVVQAKKSGNSDTE